MTNLEEECIMCLLSLAHKKCHSQKYVRVGGGYRHSYYYVVALMEEIKLRKEQEELRQQRLEQAFRNKVRRQHFSILLRNYCEVPDEIWYTGHKQKNCET